jgi:hypothetical protein
MELTMSCLYKLEKQAVQPIIIQHIRKRMGSLGWALAKVKASDDLKLHQYA